MRVQETFGARLARLRRRRGLSQRRLAELLCEASGVTTVSRHEVSRWERGLRRPAPAWRGWLAAVLGAPLPEQPREPRPAAAGPQRAAGRWAALRGQLHGGHRCGRRFGVD